MRGYISLLLFIGILFVLAELSNGMGRRRRPMLRRALILRRIRPVTIPRQRLIVSRARARTQAIRSRQPSSRRRTQTKRRQKQNVVLPFRSTNKASNIKKSNKATKNDIKQTIIIAKTANIMSPVRGNQNNGPSAIINRGSGGIQNKTPRKPTKSRRRGKTLSPSTRRRLQQLLRRQSQAPPLSSGAGMLAVPGIGGVLDAGLGNMGSGIGQGLGHMGSGIGQGLGNMGSRIGQGLGNMGSGIGQGLGHMGSGIGQGLGNMGSGIGQGLGNMGSGIGHGNLGSGIGHGNLGSGIGHGNSGSGIGHGNSGSGIGNGLGHGLLGFGGGFGHSQSGLGSGLGQGSGHGHVGAGTGLNHFGAGMGHGNAGLGSASGMLGSGLGQNILGSGIGNGNGGHGQGHGGGLASSGHGLGISGSGLGGMGSGGMGSGNSMLDSALLGNLLAGQNIDLSGQIAAIAGQNVVAGSIGSQGQASSGHPAVTAPPIGHIFAMSGGPNNAVTPPPATQSPLVIRSNGGSLRIGLQKNPSNGQSNLIIDTAAAAAMAMGGMEPGETELR